MWKLIQERQYDKSPFNFTEAKPYYLIWNTEFRISAAMSAFPVIKTGLKIIYKNWSVSQKLVMNIMSAIFLASVTDNEKAVRTYVVGITYRLMKFHSEVYSYFCRSRWPRGLSHVLSSLARTLGSWLRIPLKSWMSVCVYSVFVLSCVGSGLVKG
jgi:hypothetical protein